MNIKTLLTTSLLYASSLTLATTVGIVNMEQLHKESEFGKVVAAKMEQEQQQIEKQLATDKKQLEETDAKIKKLEQTINTIQKEIKEQEKVLTPEAKQAKIDKIISAQEEGEVLVNKITRLDRQFREQVEKLQKVYASKYQEYAKELQGYADKAIDKLQSEENLDLILPAHFTLKFKKALDVTDKAMNLLNKETAHAVKEFKAKHKPAAAKAA